MHVNLCCMMMIDIDTMLAVWSRGNAAACCNVDGLGSTGGFF